MRQVVLVLLWLCAKAVAAETIAVGQSYSHFSDVMQQERRYAVSLPSRYLAEPDRRYPVLYVVDADFQFFHVAATVRNLTQMGKIPPMIVVGVATNGPGDYVKQTTWSPQQPSADYGGAKTMHRYLSTELLPLIDAGYRTTKDRVLAGYSLGGLYVLQELMQKGSGFQAFLAMSPSAWFDDYQLAKSFASYLQQNKTSVRLFISLANEQGMGVNELVELLRLQQSPLRWQFRHFADETHYSTALPALYAGLSYLYQGYFSDVADLMPLKGAAAVMAHFKQKQAQQFGHYRIDWLQAYMLAKFFAASKQMAEISEFIHLVQQQMPESAPEVSLQLAKIALKMQQTNMAGELLQQYPQNASVDWQKQVSEWYKQLDQRAEAEQHLAEAKRLAKLQQLETWEQMELE